MSAVRTYNCPFGRDREISWPHVLSFSRIVAGPIVAALVLAPAGDAYLVAAVIFAVASLTDAVDGKLARYSQRVSPLGIFLDTTSDKVMVSLVLVSMAVAGLAAAWIPLVIIGREFLISGLRSYAASRDRIISAHIWGKGKAAVTMLAIFVVLVAADGVAGGAPAHFGSHHTWETGRTVGDWLLALAAVMTIVSGFRYVVDAWPLFRIPAEAPGAAGERPRAVGEK
jgi:CDP-diacylglycerol--glycerol-3-phosphate 3-phosphatidyltransferase